MHKILSLQSKKNNNLKLIILLALSLFFAGSCKKESIPTRSEMVLGTLCSVNAYSDASEELYQELFNRLYQIEERFSPKIPESDISMVNAAAGEKSVAVHKDVLYVLQASLRYAELSQGAFDPTIGPLVQLWGVNTDSPKVPSQEEIDKALELVDYKNLVLTPDHDGYSGRAYLKKKGMAIDLGAIAKGFAADELAAILGKHNVKKAIINLGGNIFAYGEKENSDWEIGIKNPLNPSGEIALAVNFKADNSVVTSGIYERYFVENGVFYHHIIDPKTGRPARSGLLSTTIISPSSMQADALSTTAFILGPEKYFKLKESPAIFINSDSTVFASSVLKKNLSIKSSDFQKIDFY